MVTPNGDGVSVCSTVGLPLAIVLGPFVARVIGECVKLAIFTVRTRRISWTAVVMRETAANA
jgi:hypothetical protein